MSVEIKEDGGTCMSLAITYRNGSIKLIPTAINSAPIVSGHPGILVETILA